MCECDGVCSYTGCCASVSERARTTSRISQEEATARGEEKRKKKKKKQKSSKRAVLPEDFYSQNHQRKRVCVCAHKRTHTCAQSRDSVRPEGGGEEELK